MELKMGNGSHGNGNAELGRRRVEEMEFYWV